MSHKYLNVGGLKRKVLMQIRPYLNSSPQISHSRSEALFHRKLTCCTKSLKLFLQWQQVWRRCICICNTSWILCGKYMGHDVPNKRNDGGKLQHPLFFLLLKSTYLHFIEAVATVKFLTNLMHQSFIAIGDIGVLSIPLAFCHHIFSNGHGDN